MDSNKENPIANFIMESRKKANLTQVELSDITGLGLRFIRELEQGKSNLMLSKVNQLLLFFGHKLSPTPLSKLDREKLVGEL
jgi:predicted transcriptional regulator